MLDHKLEMLLAKLILVELAWNLKQILAKLAVESVGQHIEVIVEHLEAFDISKVVAAVQIVLFSLRVVVFGELKVQGI